MIGVVVGMIGHIIRPFCGYPKHPSLFLFKQTDKKLIRVFLSIAKKLSESLISVESDALSSTDTGESNRSTQSQGHTIYVITNTCLERSM